MATIKTETENGTAYSLDQIHHEDSYNVLKELPENIFDCCITDPPYGIDFKQNMGTERETKSGIANDEKDNFPFLSAIVKEIARTLKDNSHFYWFTRWDKLDHHIPLLRKYFKIKNLLIWDKDAYNLGDLKGSYADNYECILFAQKGRREFNDVDGKNRHPAVLRFKRIDGDDYGEKIHNHQKPTEMLKFFILKSTNPNEIVLDPFCGSGATAVSAYITGRRFFTAELNEEIHKLAHARMEKVKQDCRDLKIQKEIKRLEKPVGKSLLDF